MTGNGGSHPRCTQFGALQKQLKLIASAIIGSSWSSIWRPHSVACVCPHSLQVYLTRATPFGALVLLGRRICRRWRGCGCRPASPRPTSSPALRASGVRSPRAVPSCPAGAPLERPCGLLALKWRRVAKNRMVARNTLLPPHEHPHPEERALARVSKDGRGRLWPILRERGRGRSSG